MEGARAPRSGASGVPMWVFALVPAVVVGLLVAVVAIAVRGGDDDGTRIEGPPAGLPAVLAASDELPEVGVDGPAGDARALGARYGEVTLAFEELDDNVAFAAEFGRLPDALARLLGRTLGAIQRELSPTAIGGGRVSSDRPADTVFALELVWSAAGVIEPGIDARSRAFDFLPFLVADLDGREEIAAAVVAGDMARATDLLEPPLGDRSASEIISALAFQISERIPGGAGGFRDEFLETYNAQLP